MASSTIRKAIGAVKDQTSISIAKVAGNAAPEMEVLVVKATSHDDEPPDDKYVAQILNLAAQSRGYVDACVVTVSKRLSRTRDWIVALKALMLVHRLMADVGGPLFREAISHAARGGPRILSMSGFRDDAHPNSWDHSGFVRAYASYLHHSLELMVVLRVNDDTKMFHGYSNAKPRLIMDPYGDLNEAAGKDQRRETTTPTSEMQLEEVLEKAIHLQRQLDRFLGCRPSGEAKSCRMVLVALYPVVKESFSLYVDICEALALLLDRFSEMEYKDCARAYEAFVASAKQIDELVGFYGWCKDTGVARSSEFPEVQKITDRVLGSLEGTLKEKANGRPKGPEVLASRESLQTVVPVDANEIKALPPLKNFKTPPTPPPSPLEPNKLKPVVQALNEAVELVNLRDDSLTADERGNKFALALFSGLQSPNKNGSWEAFPPSGGEPDEVTSAWQTPAAETGKADWELALVETAGNLSKQKATMAGGFDSMLLNGMYDQGAVRHQVSTTQLNGGSASSVALPGLGKAAVPVLALPGPDGSAQAVGQDPFEASLSVPPPSYVQIAEMERKQQLLIQEQQVWQVYGRDGMQGQVGLGKTGTGRFAYYGVAGTQPVTPYGMPPMYGMGQQGWNQYGPY